MNCPHCQTWNPDDKTVCWRCQTPLPRPEPPKPRKTLLFLGVPLWMWLVVALFLLSPLLWQCVGLLQSP
jgi:uncharacterized paraquat-inducible protein A